MGRRKQASVYVGIVHTDPKLKSNTIVMKHEYKSMVFDRPGKFLLGRQIVPDKNSIIDLSKVNIEHGILTTNRYNFGVDSDIFVSLDIANKLGIDTERDVYCITYGGK